MVAGDHRTCEHHKTAVELPFRLPASDRCDAAHGFLETTGIRNQPYWERKGKGPVLNVLLLCIAARAEQKDGESAPLALLARQAWLELPPGQDNHLFREACHRFLVPPSRAKEILKKAYHQQGLLDIYQNFCLALSHDCFSCPFISAPSSAHEQATINTELLPGDIRRGIRGEENDQPGDFLRSSEAPQGDPLE